MRKKSEQTLQQEAEEAANKRAHREVFLGLDYADEVL